MKNYLMCIFLAVFTISIYGQNHKNAADYRTDAINGNAIAQFYLGQSYFRGWGIKPDTIQAVYWWRKSAEQGDPTAQNNMGVAYSNGWGNLTQNKETAIYWYKKAYNPQIQKSGETKTKGSKSGKNRGKSQFQAVIEI